MEINYIILWKSGEKITFEKWSQKEQNQKKKKNGTTDDKASFPDKSNNNKHIKQNEDRPSTRDAMNMPNTKIPLIILREKKK